MYLDEDDESVESHIAHVESLRKISLYYEKRTQEMGNKEVKWAGDSMLRTMAISRLSCVVYGQRGSGKSYAVHLSEDEGEADWRQRVISVAGVTDFQDLSREILLQIFYYVDLEFLNGKVCQTMPISKYETPQCYYCGHRRCTLVRHSEKEDNDTVLKWTAWDAENRCQLRDDMITNWLIYDSSPIVVDLPHENARGIAYWVEDLLDAGKTIVLVCPVEKLPLLKKFRYLSMLPQYPFPAMDEAALMKIIDFWEDDIDKTVAEAIILRANGNPRQLVHLLNLWRVAKHVGLSELTGSVGQQLKSLPPVALTQPDDMQIIQEFVQAHKGIKMLAQEIANKIKSDYGVEMEPAEIGWKLRKLGYKSKHTKNGAIYNLGNQGEIIV